MSIPDLTKYVSVPTNVANVVAAHTSVREAVTNHAEAHKIARYEKRRAMHLEQQLMKHPTKEGKE